MALFIGRRVLRGRTWSASGVLMTALRAHAGGHRDWKAAIPRWQGHDFGCTGSNCT